MVTVSSTRESVFGLAIDYEYRAQQAVIRRATRNSGVDTYQVFLYLVLV